jgi:hypothetical protein
LAIALGVAWYLRLFSPLVLELPTALLAVLVLMQISDALREEGRGQRLLSFLFHSTSPWMGFRIELLWLAERLQALCHAPKGLTAVHRLRRHYELHWASERFSTCPTLCNYIYNVVEEMLNDYLRQGGSLRPEDVSQKARELAWLIMPDDSSALAGLVLQSPALLEELVFEGDPDAINNYGDVLEIFPDLILSLGDLLKEAFVCELADVMVENFANLDEEGEGQPQPADDEAAERGEDLYQRIEAIILGGQDPSNTSR